MQNSANTQTNRAGLSSLGVDVRQLLMIGVLAAVWIIFHIITLTMNQPGKFLSPANLYNLAVQTSVVGIMVGGMVLIIVMRQIDLSVGSVLGFVAMAMALMQSPVPLGAGWYWVVAVVLGLGLAVLIGAFNGSIVSYLGVPAFVVTMAGLLIFRNASFVASGRTLSNFPAEFLWFGQGSIGAIPSWIFGALAIVFIVLQALNNRNRRVKNGFAVRPMWAELFVNGTLIAFVLGFVLVMNSYVPFEGAPAAGIPVPVMITLVVLGFLSWMTQNTRFGRYIYAIGGNPEAALLAGINVKRTMVFVFMLMGFLTGLAAMVQSARLTSATTNLGKDLELSVIAAAVIGGTALAGGSGTIIGAALGAIFMESLRNGLVLLGVQTEWQNIIIGVVLLIAVIWNTYVARTRKV
jgi:D-xylose transport system permease protein